MKPDEIVLRQRKLEANRTTVQEIWDSIVTFIAPYRGKFFKEEDNENSQEWRQPEIYDSTAVMASQSLAANLHSRLTSPSFKWFGLRFRKEELNDDRTASEWADECADIIFNELQKSNFNIEAAEGYQDLVDFGIAFNFEEESTNDDGNFDGLAFSSIPIKECFFEEDSKKGIYAFYRKLKRTPVQLLDKFGDACPEWVRELAEDPDTPPDHKETVIFAVFRRANIKRNIPLTKKVDAKLRPFGTRWVLAKDASPLTEEGGYYDMPAFCPRWRTTSQSMWGNSPAMIALSDVISLNRLVELHIQSMEKVIDPPILTTERGLMSDMDLNPAGLTVVRDINEIAPFESRARFDVNYQEIERFRDQIREYFMLDQLMLPPMEGTPATATEISARVAQLEKIIAPTLGRIINDWLEPMINRSFNILYRNGRLPDMPEVVLEMSQDGSQLEIEYVGALARALLQDQIDGIDRWLMQVGQGSQLNPDVLDIPDWDAIYKGTGRMLGVPAKFIRSNADIKQDRNARNKKAGQLQQAQLMNEAGQGAQSMAAGAAALAPTDGEPLGGQVNIGAVDG